MSLIFKKSKSLGNGFTATGSVTKNGINNSIRKSTPFGSVSVSTKGRASVTIKTPIKGLTFRTSKNIKKLFK